MAYLTSGRGGHRHMCPLTSKRGLQGCAVEQCAVRSFCWCNTHVTLLRWGLTGSTVLSRW